MPASILVCFQFVPIIRRRFPSVNHGRGTILLTLRSAWHRWNGRIVITLLLGSNIAALVMTRWTFGGFLSSQLAIGLLAIATIMSTVLGLAAIMSAPRRIDDHRAWMIRTWAWITTSALPRSGPDTHSDALQ